MTETQAKQQKMKPLFGFRALLADIADWIRHHLLTVCFALFILLVNVISRIVCAVAHWQFPPHLAKVSFEALAHGRWYTAPISMLYMSHLGRLVIDIPLILIAFGLSESVIGKIKTMWVSVITTLGGIALGMGLCSLLSSHSPQWHAISRDGAILGPLIVFETLAGLLYTILLRQQMPPLMTLSGIALLVIGVVIAVRAKPEKPLTESVSES